LGALDPFRTRSNGILVDLKGYNPGEALDIKMIGELIGEQSGKLTSRRVLADGKWEVTNEGTGKLLGVDVSVVVTLTNEPRPDGSIYSQGHGMALTKEGDVVQFRASAVGWPSPGGSAKVRGSFFPWTASQKLGRLNGLIGVVEIEADANQNYKLKAWEWK
jgi:hypothetical protein